MPSPAYAVLALICLQNLCTLIAVSAISGNGERSLIDSSDIDQYSNPSSSASNQLQRNYDEYPMVVPKRAALLLDRLMVALHHALEERNGNRRISELYSSNNNNNNNKNNKNNNVDTADDGRKIPNFLLKVPLNGGGYDQGENYDEYDENEVPSDIDFRDLNPLSRANGETRSIHGVVEGGDGGDDGGGGGGGGIAGGRTRNGSGGTWKKCYLNVISCF